MRCTGLGIALTAGMIGGGIVALMLPHNCTVRKAAEKAADAVEDAACNAKQKINDKLDAM